MSNEELEKEVNQIVALLEVNLGTLGNERDTLIELFRKKLEEKRLEKIKENLSSMY
ncbi:MAG TPA: hypothetical protein VJ579_01525 [Candidatus Paceibacterota bacterium]|nr:hypothetical protein [Candidatus Paceibacterota bacterium]